MPSIAEDEGPPVDIIILDLVKLSTAFVQTSSTSTKITTKKEKP